MRHAAVPLAPDFWSGPAVASALAACDFPVLLEEIRRARGWTQADLAAEVGYSQSWISKVMRGKQVLTLD
ncbi:MAG: helix-turn-helix domain-containing protein, partial [Streptosporangiaceae bacterium]